MEFTSDDPVNVIVKVGDGIRHWVNLPGLSAGDVGSSLTADDILPLLLDVDGPGSGLDADTLDGLHAADLATAESFDDHESATTGVHGIPNTANIATVTDVAAALSDLSTIYQPRSADLTSIAALSTTAYGRTFLALVDAAAGRTALGLGSAATQAASAFEAAGAAAAAQAASQPLDADLTAIAALTTNTFGRSLLTAASAGAVYATLGLGTAATQAITAFDAAGAATAAQAASQPLDSDLTAIAALSTTSYGRSFLALADQNALMALIVAATDTTQGKVELATTAEATTGTDTTRAVTPAGLKAVVDAAVASLIASAPGTLDTLNELATALGNDPNFATTMTTSLAGKQPLDSDLTAIAALTTTVFGRSLLTTADAAAGRTSLGLGTAATQASTAFDASGAAAAAQAASQPLDSDLTAIAALSTTTFGRSFLTMANAAAVYAALGLGTAATQNITAFEGAGSISAHSGTTTNVHGITNTASLVLTGDSRLSNARTPTAHAASHATGGGDAITIDAAQVTSGTFGYDRFSAGIATIVPPPSGGDDTAAIDAAVSAGYRIVFQAGAYNYNGTGVGMQNKLIEGAGRGVTTINLGASSYLVRSNLASSQFTIRDMTVSGGKGLLRNDYTGVCVANSIIFERLIVTGYTECGVSMRAADWPYWTFRDCTFYAGSNTNTMGVVLSGDTSGSVFSHCSFHNNAVGVKLVGLAGQSVSFSDCDWIVWSAYAGTPRVQLWVVPKATSFNRGNGMNVRGSKFGSESLDANDYCVLYADEGAGADVVARFPATSASEGWVEGHIFSECISGCNGASVGRAFVYSTTPNLKGIQVINHQVTGQQHESILKLDSAVAGLVNMYCSGSSIVGPIIHEGAEITGLDWVPAIPASLATSVDPANRFPTGSPTAPTSYTSGMATWTVASGATKTATTDSLGGSDAASFNIDTGIAYAIVAIPAETEIVLEFDHKGPRTVIWFAYDNDRVWLRIIPASATWQRWSHRIRLSKAVNNLQIGQPFVTTWATGESVYLGRVSAKSYVPGYVAPSGGSGESNVHIGPSAPVGMTAPWLWIDTSQPSLTMWIEDAL